MSFWNVLKIRKSWLLLLPTLGFGLVSNLSAEIKLSSQPILWPLGGELEVDRIQTDSKKPLTRMALLTHGKAHVYDLNKESGVDAIPWPEHEELGLIPFRVFSQEDKSDWHFFVVDELPGSKGVKAGLKPEEAPVVQVGTTLTGNIPNLGFHYYTIEGKPGVEVDFECLANRIGSTLDVVVRVLDSSLKEILWKDDTPGYGRDLYLSWRMPRDGRALIEIRDVAFQGGNEYFYAAKVGAVPKLERAVMTDLLKDLKLRKTDERIEGDFYPGLFDPRLYRLEGTHGRFTWAYLNPGAHYWNGMDTLPDDPLFVVPERNDFVSVLGRLSDGEMKDRYKVSLRQGEWLQLAGWTRTIGSELDLVLEVLDPEGKVLARRWGEGPLQPWLVLPAKTTGDYQVRVGALTAPIEDGDFYQCDIASCLPGVQVTAEKESIQVSPGGEFEMEIDVRRYGDSRELEFFLEPKPEILTACDTYVSGKESKKILKWKVSFGAETGQLHLFRIKAKTTPVAREHGSIFVLNRSAFETQFPMMVVPPPELNGWFTLQIINRDKKKDP